MSGCVRTYQVILIIQYKPHRKNTFIKYLFSLVILVRRTNEHKQHFIQINFINDMYYNVSLLSQYLLNIT